MLRTPFVATVMSALLPGLGQLYNGERAKGIAMLSLTAGIWFWFVMAAVGPSYARSQLSQVVLAVTYFFVWLPATTDAYRVAASGTSGLVTGSKSSYVIFMVVMTGIMALPLLWQSATFSRSAKITWSVIGVLNTFLALLFLALLGPHVEQFLRDVNASFAVY